MGGKDIRAPHDLQCHIGIVIKIVDQMIQTGKRQETGVTFIHVAHCRIESERQQFFHAADAQEQFLMQAHSFIAAVQTPGDFTQIRRILRQFGIQQHQRHIADPQNPCGGVDSTIAQRHIDRHRITLFVTTAHQRQIVDLCDRIMFRLPAGTVKHLTEISLTVEQTDGDQRQRHIAGGFQVVTGKHAQTTGKDRNTLVDTVFQ